MKKILYALMAGVIVAFVGCGKDNGGVNSIQLTSTDQTMHYDDDFQIQATSETPITYTSENEYHAEVSASGLVTAGRVGETNIVMTNGEDTEKIKITVTPESNLYPEVDLTFGMTRSSVKTKLGAPTSETDKVILYDNYSSNAPILMCLFDESDKLESIAYMVKTAYSSELGTFLVERYVPAAIDGENYAILCANGLDMSSITMLVGADVYSLSYWMVLYMPYTASNARSDSKRPDVMNSINELMSKME